MTTLVYKRTHPGDPGEDGVFGNEGCMGRVRGYDFDAVIGVGGIGSEAKSYRIDGKINWIGIGAHVVGTCFRGYPQIAFEHFALFEDLGEPISSRAKELERRFCHQKAPRYALNDFGKKELAEINLLLESVKNSPPSKGLFGTMRARKCCSKPSRKKC